MKNKGLLLVVSGPAGVGKGTICKEFLKRNNNVYYSVSATTRSPREGEVDGVNYYFKTKEEFKRLIAEDKLLEYATFCNNYYGTLRDEVEKRLNAGDDIILEIEVQGAMQMKEKYANGVYIFVLPPSFEELESRLINRGTETMDIVKKRLNRALEEFELISRYDYILVNDIIEEATAKLEAIVAAEKAKTKRNVELIREVCTR